MVEQNPINQYHKHWYLKNPRLCGQTFLIQVYYAKNIGRSLFQTVEIKLCHFADKLWNSTTAKWLLCAAPLPSLFKFEKLWLCQKTLLLDGVICKDLGWKPKGYACCEPKHTVALRARAPALGGQVGKGFFLFSSTCRSPSEAYIPSRRLHAHAPEVHPLVLQETDSIWLDSLWN